MVKAIHHPCLQPNSHAEMEALCDKAPPSSGSFTYFM